jgi:hypothetical protein
VTTCGRGASSFGGAVVEVACVERDRRIPQLIPHRLLRNNQVHHPAVLEEAKRRSGTIQLRVADRITAFAGSMNFVWIPAALFAVWMLFMEKSPRPTLTLVVSPEGATVIVHGVRWSPRSKTVAAQPGSWAPS